MPRKSTLILIVSLLVIAFGLSSIARAQEAAPAGAVAPAGSSFTYQGQLKDASGPVTSSCDFQLGLWDALTGGTQVGSTLTQSSVAVSEGLFTVQLDFGANAFDGNARWLEIAVRCPAGGGAYNPLAPRQPLSPAPYALYSANADTLDGQHASAFQQHYQNLVVVAKSGGDFSTITDALNSIATNSVANPFTIYVAPGVYTETITMKPYVDIEGAGELVTKITYAGSPNAYTGTIIGANHAEIRFLTVENTGGDERAAAIYNNSASLQMTNLTVSATGGTLSNFGVYNADSSPVMMNINAKASGGDVNICVNNSSSSPIMTNVTATASGVDSWNYGVFSNTSSPVMMNITANASGGDANFGVSNSSSSSKMTNVTVTASGGVDSENYGVSNANSSPIMANVSATASGGMYSYGIWNDSSPITMTNSSAAASGGVYNYGVYNKNSSPTLTDVAASASGGTTSIGVYNSNSSPHLTNVIAAASGASFTTSGVYNGYSSPQMINVTASGTNGTTANIGVFNVSSSPIMTYGIVTAVGGTDSYGIHNTASSPVLTNIKVTASQGTSNYGLWNDSSSTTIQNSIINGSGGGTNDGIHNIASSGSYIVKIDNSQVTGFTSTIYQDSHYTTQVGASQVTGGGVFGGTYTCVASYNGNYIALNSTCH